MAHNVRREADCPRCHETCGWCSDYRFMHGRMKLPGTRRKCTVPGIEPDDLCPVCAGKKRVWMTVTYEPMGIAKETPNDQDH